MRKPRWMKDYSMERYGINGERLLLALDVIRYCWGAPLYRKEVDKERGWSEKKVRKQLLRLETGFLLSCPETIYEGNHRGGPSIGLRPLHEMLGVTRNLRCVVFNLRAIVHVFLDPWMSIVPSIAYSELAEFWRFFDAFRLGEVTEKDLKK